MIGQKSEEIAYKGDNSYKLIAMGAGSQIVSRLVEMVNKCYRFKNKSNFKWYLDTD